MEERVVLGGQIRSKNRGFLLLGQQTHHILLWRKNGDVISSSTVTLHPTLGVSLSSLCKNESKRVHYILLESRKILEAAFLPVSQVGWPTCSDLLGSPLVLATTTKKGPTSWKTPVLGKPVPLGNSSS